MKQNDEYLAFMKRIAESEPADVSDLARAFEQLSDRLMVPYLLAGSMLELYEFGASNLNRRHRDTLENWPLEACNMVRTLASRLTLSPETPAGEKLWRVAITAFNCRIAEVELESERRIAEQAAAGGRARRGRGKQQEIVQELRATARADTRPRFSVAVAAIARRRGVTGRWVRALASANGLEW